MIITEGRDQDAEAFTGRLVWTGPAGKAFRHKARAPTSG